MQSLSKYQKRMEKKVRRKETEQFRLTSTEHSPAQPHNSSLPVPSNPTLKPDSSDGLHRRRYLSTLTPERKISLGPNLHPNPASILPVRILQLPLLPLTPEFPNHKSEKEKKGG